MYRHASRMLCWVLNHGFIDAAVRINILPAELHPRPPLPVFKIPINNPTPKPDHVNVSCSSKAGAAALQAANTLIFLKIS